MSRKRGFTLIELLVVISIIALLMGILMPALSRARKQAKILVCKSRLKQLGMGIFTYASSNDGKLLPTEYEDTGGWQILHPEIMFRTQVSDRSVLTGVMLGALGTSGIIKDPRCFLCPNDQEVKYLLAEHKQSGAWDNMPHLDSDYGEYEEGESVDGLSSTYVYWPQSKKKVTKSQASNYLGYWPDYPRTARYVKELNPKLAMLADRDKHSDRGDAFCVLFGDSSVQQRSCPVIDGVTYESYDQERDQGGISKFFYAFEQ